MTEEQIKEVMFYTIIQTVGGPPIDTQLAVWQKAVDEMYIDIKDSFSFQVEALP